MTLPYSNLSKFLKLFMLIHSILFIHSIAIEDYVLKNYGIKLNVSAMQFQRQIQNLIPPTDQVSVTFTNSSGGTYNMQLTCTPTPSSKTTTCSAFNEGTNDQFFDYQKFNITQITFSRNIGFQIGANVINQTTYASNPLTVNFAELTYDNITWSMNPIPSAQFNASFLIPNSSNQFTNCSVQIIGNVTDDKSVLIIQYLQVVLPYYYLDLTKPEPTFGQNTIQPSINLNVNFTNQSIFTLASNAYYNQSCNFVYNFPFQIPSPQTIWLNGTVTYPNTDPSTTYSYNQSIVLEFSKFQYKNVDISFNQYQSFTQFYQGNSSNPNQLVENITIYGQLAVDKSTLNITFIQINFNNVANNVYNFSYIPIQQQHVTNSASVSFMRTLFEPEVLGQFIYPAQNYTYASQSFDNNTWMQTINFDLNGNHPYYVKQSNLTKYGYWIQTSTNFNLTVSYNVVTEYQFGNGTLIFSNAVNNSQTFPTFDALVQEAYAQNSVIYDPINGINYCNVTISFPLTAMFNEYTMYNFGSDNIFLSFTATQYTDYPLDLTGGQYFALIAIVLLFLGLVFMFFWVMHSKASHYQSLQKGDKQGRKLITNQLYDV